MGLDTLFGKLQEHEMKLKRLVEDKKVTRRRRPWHSKLKKTTLTPVMKK